MGPKPFSSGSAAEFSFDKVFSVPQVPGIEVPPQEVENVKPDLIPIERPPYFDEPEPIEEEEVSPTTGEPPKIEEEIEVQVELCKPDDEVFKRPTTAERRKVKTHFFHNVLIDIRT